MADVDLRGQVEDDVRPGALSDDVSEPVAVTDVELVELRESSSFLTLPAFAHTETLSEAELKLYRPRSAGARAGSGGMNTVAAQT